MFRRIFITIALYLLYRLGFYFPIVFIPEQSLSLLNSFSKTNYSSLFGLGFSPVILGFMLVEILFILLPNLRNFRRSGLEGRKFINRWALATSFFVATLEAWYIVQILITLINPIGSPLINNPTFFISIYYTLVLVSGFALILFLGNLISKHGIGNGFCIFYGFSIIEEIIRNSFLYYQDLTNNNLKPNFIGLMILFFIFILLFKILNKKDWIVSLTNEKVKAIQAPFFIQGAVVITFPVYIYSIIMKNMTDVIFEYGSWSYALVILILTFISSVFGYWFFSSQKRIALNISTSYRPFFMSTILICILSLVFIIPFPFWDQMLIPHIISLFSAICLVAISLDLWQQSLFHYKNKTSVEIISLDNIYSAALIKEKLNLLSIDHCLQAYQYRRLYFFLQPFIKIKLLVEKDKAQEVKQIIQDLSLKEY